MREMVEKVKKEIAERNKKEFKQTFEKARGKTVDECFVGVEWMCVKKETICPDKIPSWIGPAVTILGGVVNTIAKFTPAAAISIACDICTYAGVGITVIDVLSNDDPYDQFVVDVGGTCDWHRDPNTGEWTGRAIGEIYYFNIIKEQGESVGLEFAGASRYTTTVAEKGFYMYDFDFGFSTLINPF